MATSSKFDPGPTLAELLSDPLKINGVPREAIPCLRGELAHLDTLLLGRLLTDDSEQRHNGPLGDRLLDAAEAAAKLGTSKDWIYRHAAILPFVMRVGKKQLRFSESGIERYIQQRSGR
jgi:predicted DNA-binding transcriptional regulator AlpA